ncbi:hypothetical protein COY17_00990 [Candidatus Saccharibacteria bacterium CG_4_10_14_0_2_um_filter_52_9]|nr:MAG: hypothetical protein COY17_00990 [Candidatus Saccharibacteria bacterium CG_4_10_14_0_2_um_filter_52_9]
MSLTFAIILLLLAIGGIVVRKTYYSLPTRELKRQAENNDPQAASFYRAVAYGGSLRSLLWLYIGLTSAASFILLARQLPVWASLLIVGPLLWATFSWLPATRVTAIGTKLTGFVTPLITKILSYLHPVLHRTARVADKHVAAAHTGLFERDDLVRLIEQQQSQTDSRFSDEELEIAKRALGFADRQVGDILTSRKKIKTVMADDTIGPILIDELHKSGQGVVLVRAKAKDPIIGTLEFKRLNLESTGTVRDVMNPAVYYIHEEDSLGEALHAFFATNHPVFVVVNSFEEFVGVITIENILQELLGHVPGEEFAHHTNLEAVAGRHSKAPETEESVAEPVKADEEVIE